MNKHSKLLTHTQNFIKQKRKRINCRFTKLERQFLIFQFTTFAMGSVEKDAPLRFCY